MTPERLAEIRAWTLLPDGADHMYSECAKCHEDYVVDNGSDPSPCCHLCAQEIVSVAIPELLDEVGRLRFVIESMKQEAADAARDAIAEERWKNRQGEDYGSY